MNPPRTADLAARLVDLSLDDAERLHALGLAIPSGGAISLRAAAALHGFHIFGHREQGQRIPLQCTISRGREHVRRPGVESFTATLRGDVVDLGGLPVTSVERTVVDIARYTTPDVAIAMLDRSLRMGLWKLDDVLELAKAFSGERNIKQARYLVRSADPGAESPAESACRLRVLDAGFPRPQTQIYVSRGHGRHFRLDMGWLEMLKALEFDGFEPHLGPEAVARDNLRRDWLHGRGWGIVVAHRGNVFGTSMELEYAIGEFFGMAPKNRRRLW